MKVHSCIVLVLLCWSCRQQDIVKDADGNSYRTVTIGKQVWMAENLKVTRYRNGDPLIPAAGAVAWAVTKDGAWCEYGNDTSNGKIYGHLYNWYAVNDVRGLAPEGWHIPSAQEIAELVSSLKGDTVAASHLKEKGNRHWLAQGGQSAAGDTGFDALPGGYRAGEDGSFHTLGSNGYWWSATRSYELFAWSPRLFEALADVDREKYYNTYGFAVRCIKD